MELFSRRCVIENEDGVSIAMDVAFHAPERTGNDEYTAKATVSCDWLQSRVLGIGTDAAQAFFALPRAATSCLVGLRRYGYEVYWLEKGDLDCADFWTYRQ